MYKIFINDKSLILDESEWKNYREDFRYIEAAGGLVKNSRDNFLFIFRNGKWDLPKGKVESGESIEEGAVREVEEECGISPLKVGIKLPSTYHTYELNDSKILKETHWFEMSYQGNQPLIPQKEEGIEEVKWIAKEDLEMVEANTYASILDVLSSHN